MSTTLKSQRTPGAGEMRTDDNFIEVDPSAETTFKEPYFIRRLPDGWLRGYFETSDNHLVVLLPNNDLFSDNLILSTGEMAVRAKLN
jgi:hypothetical protein